MRSERNAPLWLKIIVWFHVFAITVVCLPRPPADIVGEKPKRKPFGNEWLLLWNKSLAEIIQVYTWPTGTWQSWDMFAPNPSDWEGYVSAVVTFRDGSKKGFSYPRMRELGLFEKYFKERYRKFLERAHHDSHSWIRPYFARRIALLSHTDPANPPTLVELQRHWYTVPPTITFGDYVKGVVTKGAISPPNPPIPQYEDTIYFTYVVRQKELKELGGL